MTKGRTGDGGRDDHHLFREAVRGAVPIKPANRVEPQRQKPAPIPVKREEDERAVLHELLMLTDEHRGQSRFSPARDSGSVPIDIEIEEDHLYLRPGLPRDILRKLRRMHWVIQDHLDLHGLTGDEAVAQTAVFLADCRRRGKRCVRIVHGKGLRSPGREPVLKRRIRKLLTRRGEVLAFVEPRAIHGGGGAVVVLLEA
ncbi:MAG TPA: Smr/MutS family protein [Usitatibacter sp.]|nr:Smr/MutS family protein [Usitatibacter sp.]